MKYIAYYRVSTKQQGSSGLGLKAQRESVERYVSNLGGRLSGSFTEVESGRKASREELKRAIVATKDNKATLVIAKLDRLSRNASFTFSLMDSGVKFVAVDAPNVNELTIKILAVIAENEAKMISQRTRVALSQTTKKLGTPRNLTHEGRIRSIKVRGKLARNNENNRKAWALIKELPLLTNVAISDKLNSGGFLTSRGSSFTPVQVRRLKKMYYD